MQKKQRRGEEEKVAFVWITALHACKVHGTTESRSWLELRAAALYLSKELCIIHVWLHTAQLPSRGGLAFAQFKKKNKSHSKDHNAKYLPFKIIIAI